MGVLYGQTKHLTFLEALELLVEEYRQRGVSWDLIMDDCYAVAGEILEREQRASEESAYCPATDANGR